MPKCKRVLERMWNVLLVCFNPGGVSFKTLHCHGMKVSFGRLSENKAKVQEKDAKSHRESHKTKQEPSI